MEANTNSRTVILASSSHYKTSTMYLEHRSRILRRSAAVRSLVAETILTPNDFILPIFIDEGKNICHEISSMPGCFRRSVDLTIVEAKELWSLGIKSVLLFVKTLNLVRDPKSAFFWVPVGPRPGTGSRSVLGSASCNYGSHKCISI